MPPGELAFTILDRSTYAGSPKELRQWAHDIGSVHHDLDVERRTFLLVGDISFVTGTVGETPGIDVFPALHLPLAPPGGSGIDIAIEDPTRWGSFRVYDNGLCSQLVPPDSMANLITSGFDKVLARADTIQEEFHRIDDAFVQVHLRGDPDAVALDTPSDFYVFSAQYRACDRYGCPNLTISIRVEFGFERIPGTLRDDDPGCGSSAPSVVPETYDFQGIVYDADVEVEGFCPFEDDMIEPGIEARIRDRMPGAIRDAIRKSLVLSWLELGLGSGVRRCRCHADCDIRSPDGPAWGPAFPRSPCDTELHTCDLQLEPDRVNVRPDGFEVVIMEDESDSQLPIIDLTPNGVLIRDALCQERREDPGPEPAPIPWGPDFVAPPPATVCP